MHRVRIFEKFAPERKPAYVTGGRAAGDFRGTPKTHPFHTKVSPRCPPGVLVFARFSARRSSKSSRKREVLLFPLGYFSARAIRRWCDVPECSIGFVLHI